VAISLVWLYLWCGYISVVAISLLWLYLCCGYISVVAISLVWLYLWWLAKERFSWGKQVKILSHTSMSVSGVQSMSPDNTNDDDDDDDVDVHV